MNLKLIEAMKVAKRVAEYNLGIKEGERVLIITDYESDFDVAQCFSLAAQNIGAEASIIIMETRKRPSDEPSDTVGEAMKGADVLIWPAKWTLTHSKKFRKVRATNTKRAASIPGMTLDYLLSPAVNIDYEEMNRTGEAMLKVLRNGKTVRVTSESGTDFTVDLTKKRDDENFSFENGMANNAPGFMMLPAGAIGLYFKRPPIRDKNPTNGVAVFDASHMFGELKTRMKWTIEDGWVTKIEGGEQAKQFEAVLKGYENAFYLEEVFGIGTNPGVGYDPDEIAITRAKRKAGGIHIGLGGGHSHFDGAIYEITLDVDGQKIIENGKIVV